MPISSAVRSRNVASRQLSISRSPSNTPSTMLLLPTSMAKSMMSDPTDLSGEETLHAALHAHQQSARGVDVLGAPPNDAGRRVPFPQRASQRGRPLTPRAQDSIEPSLLEIGVPLRDCTENLGDDHTAVRWSAHFR